MLATVSACTESATGTPSAADSSSTTSSTTEPTLPTVSGKPAPNLPKRPEDLKLDGVDPCTLLTPPQLDQLKINNDPQGRTSDNTYKSPACAFRVTAAPPRYAYQFVAITKEGISAWLTQNRPVKAKVVSVAGFAAIDFSPAGDGGVYDCITTVDVADGQQLLIEVTPSTRGVFSQEQLCQMSEQAAGLAVATLQTLK